ncbi:four helix bundle protein [Chryseobacterium sp. T20]|uniref:four helix bundle protein n=1 Tax=Chryseobacterium sp. T20 TaxID=3395375 RepID=UPI0039BD5789
MSYRNLDIYKKAFDLFLKTHKASHLLPKYELFELGSQLRRSSDSVITNIVEGYGRSTYKNDYIRFLIYSHASNDETINHLEKIIILYPNFSSEFEILRNEYNTFGGKINIYKKWVIENWNKKSQQ